jgi:DNA-binding GntR family transcriptional regulator
MSIPGSSGMISFAISRSAAPVRIQIEEYLRREILGGHLLPGTRLIERELCDHLKVSRTVLREALGHLEERGLIQHIPQKGLVVATMTLAEAEEIYQISGVVAAWSVRMFNERASSQQRLALQETVADFEAALHTGDVRQLAETKGRFATLLVVGAGNRTMTAIVGTLQDRVTSLRRLNMAQPGWPTQSLDQMRRILAAALAGNSDDGAQACIEHAQSAAKVAAQAWRQPEAETAPKKFSRKRISS